MAFIGGSISHGFVSQSGIVVVLPWMPKGLGSRRGLNVGNLEFVERYRLVQAKKKKISPPRIPLAVSSQRVNIWYRSEPHGQWKRVTWPKKQITGLGLSLGAKLVSTNDRPSLFSKIFRLCPSGGEKKYCVPHFARSGWTHSKACL